MCGNTPPKRSRRPARWATVALVCALLAACGQKGPLFLPEDDEDDDAAAQPAAATVAAASTDGDLRAS